ncbi:MAG: sugar phosphate isomerase/epimerase, partial [Candidatus Pacebacteria bacterium]|nr:sugar phosphate isomerase/epimerase [Candidatus Paceibacterota bacterium]
TDDRTKPQPYPKQSAWEFYKNVKQHIAYIHIKDYRHDPAKSKNECFTFAGEGNGDVKRIVKDLLDNGYDGGISMEPHIAAVFHDPTVQSDDDLKYKAYIEYGRRFMELLKEIGHGDKI